MQTRPDIPGFMVIMLLTLVMNACNPGSGSSGNTGNQNTADTTAPIIASTVPESGQYNIRAARYD